MAEITKFQQMNGCSACKFADGADPQGKSAGSYAANFWCRELQRPVLTRDGAACPKWEYQS